MNTQHTPGPWAIYVNAPSDVVIRKMSKDGYELCAIARVSSGYANAHLIAAAPELLEALDAALKLIELVMPIDGDVTRKARAAIAKAKGGAA